MSADHERWLDTAAAYLLGALPDDELEAYEAHLAGCATCREEVDELAPAAHALPTSVEPIAAPPALQARIMIEVEREASLLAAAGPEADRPPAHRRRRRRTFSLPRLAPVAVGAALLVVGVAAGLGIGQLGGTEGRTIAAQVDPAQAPDAQVDLELEDDGVTLIARGLPAPPRDRVYQVWLKRPGQAPEPTSALFSPGRDGTATATVPGPHDDVEQVLVTDEPDGGSRVPTRDPLVVADVS